MCCDARTFAPQLVVELDDASHDREDRSARDAFVDEVLAGVGLPILHVRWQRHYNAVVLAAQVRAVLGDRAAIAQPVAAPPPAPTAPAPQPQHCGQCGAALRAGAKFCPQCGMLCSPA